MKIKKVFLGSVFFLLGSFLPLFGQAGPALPDFHISGVISKNKIKLDCTSCPWTSLSTKYRRMAPIFIDSEGISKGINLERFQNSEFVFQITISNSKVNFKSMTGTSWTSLSAKYSPSKPFKFKITAQGLEESSK